MAEPTGFIFSLKELTELLVRKQGITEGTWAVTFNLGLGAGLMGNAPEELKPSAIVQINNVQLNRTLEEGSPPPFAVDAAALKPEAH